MAALLIRVLQTQSPFANIVIQNSSVYSGLSYVKDRGWLTWQAKAED